jgi:hypothetical protein
MLIAEVSGYSSAAILIWPDFSTSEAPEKVPPRADIYRSAGAQNATPRYQHMS